MHMRTNATCGSHFGSSHLPLRVNPRAFGSLVCRRGFPDDRPFWLEPFVVVAFSGTHKPLLIPSDVRRRGGGTGPGDWQRLHIRVAVTPVPAREDLWSFRGVAALALQCLVPGNYMYLLAC